jgi:hypothetical protein
MSSGKTCEWCDEPATHETDEFDLCDEHFEQHCDGYSDD